MGSLEQKVKDRIKEAEDKNISGKAYTIAKYLGYGTDEKKYTNLQFENDSFHIKYNFSERYSGDSEYGDVVSSSESVKYKGQTVFDEEQHEIKSYIPGEWEEKLNKLYTKAQKNVKKAEEAEMLAEKQRASAAKAKEESELRERFGL